MTTRGRRRRMVEPESSQRIQAQIERNQAAIKLLESWLDVSEEEAAEQRETGEYLMRALDEERRRIGARTLFS